MAVLSTWDTGTSSGLISIGTHSLYLTAAGPCRETVSGRLQPAVIIEAGLGSGHLEWVAVSRLISERARVYTYDRAGYGRSQPSPVKELNAQNRVNELHQLLGMAGIDPPYVLVGHSYGGTLVREFLRQHREDIVGMVLVDAPRTPTPLPPGFGSLFGDSTYGAIVGLNENHVFSPEEYAAINEDEDRNSATAEIELSFIPESVELVNRALPEGFQAMGDDRLSVIFANETVDFGKIYGFAVEHGVGTQEAKDGLAVRLKNMEQGAERDQRMYLGLSSQSRFVYARGKAMTHNMQYVAPEVIRDEVFWVLGLTE
ncbi:alpha/beta-hydrolase [Aspergillus heteromorphus CBS 117.55]|uniref:Alpha/beta-hydrolase n=1 Tax=Aspergillus heteromorphus CBS 117.55 TaxID=1448321 RepID=A0A317WCZ5_9EURO|nr:alpha/beta-hydrolase [Aspergillus heteromorphus CBS 117.55]PWY83631.1 alpha/beta-hydrolase [Aspergillus heteromorphus CBS 117.55]